MQILIAEKPVNFKAINLVVFYNPKNKCCLSSELDKKEPALVSFLNKLVASFVVAKDKQAAQIFEIFDSEHSTKARKILLVGIQTSLDKLWSLKLGAKVARKLLTQKQTEFHILFPASGKDLMIADFYEGLWLGGYSFGKYYTDKKRLTKLAQIKLIGVDKKLATRLTAAKAVAAGVKLARDVSNLGGNDFTPHHFKEESRLLAKRHKLKLTVLTLADFKKLGMDCFYAVAKGTIEKAFLNIIEYHHAKSSDTVMVVGKGLTFDSGGYSLKPSSAMEEMKFDMCGGASVLGVMDVVGALRPKVNVVGMIATTENLISSSAYKPGDVFKTYNGKTVEIINTDAEGRLVLADTFAYGIKKYKPVAVVDLATLTGACMVALGKWHSGLFCNNDKLTARIKKSALAVGESVWPLPLDEEYGKELKSDYADLKNVGGRYAGASSAAKFLEHFVAGVPWAHLDIAGTAWNVGEVDFYPAKGATGVGVRLIYNLLDNWQAFKK